MAQRRAQFVRIPRLVFKIESINSRRCLPQLSEKKAGLPFVVPCWSEISTRPLCRSLPRRDCPCPAPHLPRFANPNPGTAGSPSDRAISRPTIQRPADRALHHDHERSKPFRTVSAPQRHDMISKLLPALRGTFTSVALGKHAAPRVLLSPLGSRLRVALFTTTSPLPVKQMPHRPKPPPEEEIDERFLKGSGPGGQKIVCYDPFATIATAPKHRTNWPGRCSEQNQLRRATQTYTHRHRCQMPSHALA